MKTNKIPALTLIIILFWRDATHGSIYKPLDFTLQRDVAVLNLGKRLNLLPSTQNCCASKFSTIFLDIWESRELERFLNSTLYPRLELGDEGQPHNQADLVLSLCSYSRNDSWMSGIKETLQRDGNLDKLKSRLVTGISLTTGENLCSTSRNNGGLQKQKGFAKVATDLGTYLQANGLSFGFHFVSQCEPDFHPEILPVFQVPSFFVIRLDMDQVAYTFDKFSGILQTLVSTKVNRIISKNPGASVILELGVERPLEAEIREILSHPDSFSGYKNLVTAFSYKAAATISVGAGRSVKVMGRFDGESGDIPRWTEIMELRDVGCCESAADSWVVDVKLGKAERETMVDIISRDFSNIQVDTSNAGFWNLTFPDLASKISRVNTAQNSSSKPKLSLTVTSRLEGAFGAHGWDVVLHDAERLRILVSAYPHGLVRAFVIVIPYLFCFPFNSKTSVDYKFVNASMLEEVRKRLHPSQIPLGLSDCSTIENFYRVDKELEGAVDLVQLVFDSGVRDVARLPASLEKLRRRIGERYSDSRKVAISTSWQSSNYQAVDCLEFRRFMETVRNWARVHSQRISIEDVFLPRATSWYKQISHSSFKKGGATQSPSFLDGHAFLGEMNDSCVMLDEGEFTEPINFTKSLAGVSLRLDQGRFANIATESRIMLYEFATLRFSVVEIVLGDLGKLPPILQGIVGEASSQSEIELYINLKPGMSTDLVQLVKSTANLWESKSKTGLYEPRGFHLDLSELPGPIKLDESTTVFLQSIRLAVPPSIKVGLMVAFKGQTQVGSDEEKRLLQYTDYLILDIDLLKAIYLHEHEVESNYVPVDLNSSANILQEAQPQLFSTELYSIFQCFRGYRYSARKVRADVVVMLRLRWPSVEEDRGSIKNFLQIWNFVNDFSSAFDFPVLIYEGFGVEERVGSYGWWKVADYADLQNGSVYTDKEAEYLGRDTFRPKPKKKGKDSSQPMFQSALMLIPMIVLLWVFICITAFLAIRARQRNLVLSKLEVKNFLYGYKLEGRGLGGGNGIEVDILGGVYKSELEISPHEIKFGSSSVIGVGNFGIVYKTQLSRFGGEVAVKVPKEEGANKCASTIRSLLAEIKIMSYIGEHDNVLKLLGAYTKEMRKGVVYLVSEFCEKGSLISHLRSLPISSTSLSGSEERLGPAVDLYELNRFCIEIGQGMKYLGSKRVIHGDLSARNVLLTRTKICKISDFGLSRTLEKYEVYKKQGTDPLPWRWMAIESLQRKEFTVKSDMWSYGVTVWEIFSLGETPFPELSWDEEYCKKLEGGLRLGAPRLASADVHGVIKGCWNLEPEDRPRFSEMITFFLELQTTEYERPTE